MKLITDDGNECVIENVKVADLNKDDVLILRFERPLSEETCHRLSEKLKGVFGKHRKIIIFDAKLDIEILRRI